ncbi:MAG: hypothetical protein JWN14_4379 [Chthonomonadales bacterium]|nr:hypothetical protein [Chthonomonadales bacterium]
MKSVLLLLLILLISSGFGRVLLSRFTVLKDSPLERFAYGTAIGLGVAALGVFALGMVGQLSFLPVTLWWLMMALVGCVGTLGNFRDTIQGMGRGARPARIFRPQMGGTDLTYANLIAPVSILVLLAIGLFCVCACFQPPAGHEWDALAYHLADPKLFLAQHRITSLPTEHHSNFPFLMEMLYCVALLYDKFPLANLLHLTMGGLTLIAIVGFCRRVLPGQVGWIAVLILITTPVYLWECCVAYLDVTMGLYLTLAAFAGTMMIETMHAAQRPEKQRHQRELQGASEGVPDSDQEDDRALQRRRMEWGLLGGIATGFALDTKYLALVPLVLLPLLLLYRRVPLRPVLTLVGVAALIGCPWYIKNILLTHNPVYPFLFKLFPASTYWSADRAAPYQAEQAGFGYPHAFAYPGTSTDNLFQSIVNLFQTPWHLLTTPQVYANTGDFHFMALLGGLYAAGIFPLAFLRKLPRPVVNLFLLFGVQLIVWFFNAQHIRYLICLMPLGAVIAAYGLSAVTRLDRPPGKQTARNLRLFPTVVTLIVTGQVLFFAWALCSLPTSPRVAALAGVFPTAINLPEALKNATEPDTWEDYTKRRLEFYEPMEWINLNTPPSAGVVLYDEVRGFYLDRPYLWGAGEHSSYIPYSRMQNGVDLTSWLRQHGIRYVVINVSKSPFNPHTEDINGRELEFLRDWYEEKPAPGTWRYIVADALRRGLWTATPEHTRGVVVLEITGGDASPTTGASKTGRTTP